MITHGLKREKRIRRTPSDNDYISNKLLQDAYNEWQPDKCESVQDANLTMPRAVQDAIMILPTRLIRKHNFSGYSENWKQDMIADAVEHLLKAAPKFDYTRFDNWLAYATTCATRSFLQVISKNKREQYVCDSLELEQLELAANSDTYEQKPEDSYIHDLRKRAVLNEPPKKQKTSSKIDLFELCEVA